jgi:hypothetical protein
MIVRYLQLGQPAMPFCHLSFSGRNGFDEVCAEHYHLLREIALDHDDANLILQAIKLIKSIGKNVGISDIKKYFCLIEIPDASILPARCS